MVNKVKQDDSDHRKIGVLSSIYELYMYQLQFSILSFEYSYQT